MSFDLGLKGRRALVTGGTKGVGAAVVASLLEAGVAVATTARFAPESHLDGVHYIAADITTAIGCATVAAGVIDRLGGVDILVNVLGGSTAPAGGFAALNDDEWQKEFNLNLMPTVRLDRALLPSMLDQGSGVIVHVTSIQHGRYQRNWQRPHTTRVARLGTSVAGWRSTIPRFMSLILGPADGLSPSTRKGSDYAERAAAPALPVR